MGDVKRGLRTVRNVVRNYNDAQVKVREATSNDAWGPAASLMADIADMTYNHLAFSDIMQMLWKRLNDNGKDWRHVYKALVVLDYIIKAGTDKVAQHCVENLYFIQTLQNFQYSEENKDLGMNVREKAKQVVALLTDDEKLKNERAKAVKTRERFQYGGMGGAGSLGASLRGDPTWGSSDLQDSVENRSGGSKSSDVDSVRPQTANEEEIQLQIALALSKEEADEEERRRQRDDVRLQLALSESQTDYHKAGKPVQASSADELFDVFHTTDTSSPTTNRDPWGDSFDTKASTSQSLSHDSDPWSVPATIHPSSASTIPFSQTKPGGDLLSTDVWSTSPSSAQNNGFTSSPSASNINHFNRKPAAVESFLGPNSSLVNLDALVGGPRYPAVPPHNTNTASSFSNPFGLDNNNNNNSTSSTPANPFHHSAAPAPTINQLRNPTAYSHEAASHLPQPLLPLNTAFNNVNASVSQQSVNSNNSFNPFL